jgi:hypothetical protein
MATMIFVVVVVVVVIVGARRRLGHDDEGVSRYIRTWVALF